MTEPMGTSGPVITFPSDPFGDIDLNVSHGTVADLLGTQVGDRLWISTT
jgi:hypothetical protein